MNKQIGEEFYHIGNQVRCEFTLYPIKESPSHPTVAKCRYAALQLNNKGQGYVVYDRLLSRIVDGVYYGDNALENALEVAQLYNKGCGNPDMSPNGDALNLQYPQMGNEQ